MRRVPQARVEHNHGEQLVLRQDIPLYQSRIVTRLLTKKLKEVACFYEKGVNFSDVEFYSEFRKSEIKSQIDMGCFEISLEKQSRAHRIYRYRLLDKVKRDGTKRPRLFIAACHDKEHGLFSAAPTMKRILLQLLLAFAVIKQSSVQVRDVTKVFIMSRIP